VTSSPDPAAWRRLKEVFHGAVAFPPSRRAEYLDTACEGDTDLRLEVERLLASHDDAGAFLDAPAAASYDPETTVNLAGRMIGPYQVLTFVGAGGMGQVYKAHDTRLDRTVAIKVLPAHVARDAQARDRFEREARAVAALNHPHICTLHDIGHQDGLDFLVMEYLEGETLGARLAKGPVPVAQAVQYAIQIASALDKAHRAGLVHRDPKPGNVMLTPAGAKLLDFGLAKPVASIAAAAPTLPAPLDLTTPGTIIGTVQYMAPEQLEGKLLDGRTDIFAFGAVVFEMLTGKKAFEGSSPASLMASILDQDPPRVSSLQPLAHPSLDHLVERCLAKDPDERWQSIRDVMLELRSLRELPPPQAPVTPAPRTARINPRLGWILSAGLVIALAATLAVHTGGTPPDQRRVKRLGILPPEHTTFRAGYGAPYLALSPDGQRLAFVPIAIGGRTLVWIRALDSLTATPLAGTDGATYPFWSPDGRQLGFFADGKLKSIDPSGGAPYTICDAPDSRGAAWSRGGVIVFAPKIPGPLYRVAAGGGSPVAVTALDGSRQELSHRLPSFLPDGRHFLFFAQSGTPEHNVVYIGSLDSKERRRLGIVGSRAAYGGGVVVFLRDQVLVAQKFDPSRLQLSGEPVALGDRVSLRSTVGGDALFSVSDNGTLAYWAGEQSLTHLTWFDRHGRTLGTLGAPADNYSLSLSPDGEKVAVESIDPATQLGAIWVIDVATGIRSRFTFSQRWDWGPVWSRDGARIAFGSLRAGPSSLYMKESSGRKAEELLVKSSAEFFGVSDWSPDGKLVVFQSIQNFKVGVLPVAGERLPKFVSQTEFLEADGRLSPDGRWLAYTSNESGAWDVYVQAFPSFDRKWRVSPDGGWRPRWRADGKELFYVAPDQRLMAVPITTGSSFAAGIPSPLFQLHMMSMPPMYNRQEYAAAAKGDRFLVNTVAEPPLPSPVTVVLNFDAALNNR
jgi:eukaryotic-like serine/threonine-protein kinase